MRANSSISSGIAIVTTQAPEVNFEARNTQVAIAVIAAPVPFSTTRARHLPPRVRTQ